MGLTAAFAELTNPLSQTPGINYASNTDSENPNVRSTRLLDESSYVKKGLFTTKDANWMDELSNLADIKFNRTRNFTSPQSQADNTVNSITQKERDRIEIQKRSSETNRTDAFSIGTVTLYVPPTQITISEEKHNYKFKPLRNEADIIASSGRSTMRIDMEIIFSGLDDINSKLRPLLAQFKCTPFLPIENEYIRSVINPEDKSIYSPIKALDEDVDKLNKLKEKVAKLESLSSNIARNMGTATAELVDLKSKGVITELQHEKIAHVLHFIETGKDSFGVLRDPTVKQCLVTDHAGQQSIDVKAFIDNTIRIPNKSGQADLVGVARSLSNIEKLSKISEDMSREVEAKYGEYEEKYSFTPIVGVLSQFSISTTPGYPEALNCRLSMYLFNYDAYVSHFGFIKGYDKDNFTPDITECDLFIDWYAGRFLNANSANALKEYDGFGGLVFRYASSISYEDVYTNRAPKFEIETVSMDDHTVVTGMSVSLGNTIQFLPILSSDLPTCQYMGTYNTTIRININSVDLDKVKKIRRMINLMGAASRSINRVGRFNVFRIENSLCYLLGIRYFVLEDFSIETVPGNPGLYNISLSATEAKLNAERSESINRFMLDSFERIKDAAGFILDGAVAYVQDPKKNANKQVYYQMLYGPSTEDSDYATPLYKIISNNLSKTEYLGKTEYFDSESVKANRNAIKSAGVNSYYDDIDLLIKDRVRNATKPNGNPLDLDSERDFLTTAIAMECSEQIKTYLSQDDPGMVDLKSYVFKNINADSAKENKIVDTSCYPDLALPTYSDLGGQGEKIKLTYKDIGMLEQYPGMREKPVQIDAVAVEPDAFFWKNSIYKVLDNYGNPAYLSGLETYKDVMLCNRIQYAKPIEQTEAVKKLDKALSDDNLDNNAIDVDKTYDAEDEAASNLSDGECVVRKVLAPGIYEVQATNQVIEVANKLGVANANKVFIVNDTAKPMRYSELTSPETGGFLSKDADKRNRQLSSTALIGKTIMVDIVSDNTIMYKNGVAVGANIWVKDGADGSFKTSRDVLTDAGVKMYTDPGRPGTLTKGEKPVGVLQYSDTLQDRANVAGEVTRNRSVTTGKIIKKVVDKSATPAKSTGSDSVIKSGDEVSQVALETEGLEGDDGIISNRYFYDKQARNSMYLNPKEANATLLRFDRHGEDHFHNIAKRVTDQSKDNLFRMVKAFPTFKFYFVEEDRMAFKPIWMTGEWRNLDDLYSYNAVLDIDITKNRKEAADVAVVRLLNTKGKLDKEKFGLYDPDSAFRQREPLESQNPETFGTVDEQQEIEEFVLKVGTRIKIKMGYTSDPSLLDLVFTGMISEISAGDVITIVAQGYGVELMKKITGWNPKFLVSNYTAYKILDKLITRPEIVHFGFKELTPFVGISQRILWRRLQPDQLKSLKNGYGYVEPSWWRNIGVINGLMHRLNDPRNDNIFTPEVKVWTEETKGERFDFLFENRTVWDICQDLIRRMPGYITQVIPFDNRATLYFGPSDGYYCYSNEVKAILKETNSYMSNFENVIQKNVKDGRITELSNDEKKALLGKFNSILTQYQELDTEGDTTSRITGALEFMKSIGKDTTEDYSMLNDLLKMQETGGTGSYWGIENSPSSIDNQLNAFTADQNKLDNWRLFKGKDGRYYDDASFVAQKRYDSLLIPPYFKLVRHYHYKSSLRDIVANSIVATDENMWNRVEVVYGRRMDRQGNYMAPQMGGGSRRVVAQVDDNIWREKIKTRINVEPNAYCIEDAWMYAVGSLRQGLNEMYSGTLTILGDPTIKPYDVIFMNDSFNDMHGAFEVREVTHHFSQETGFVTTIVPDCIAYANNSVEMGSDAIAGGWYDDVANSLIWVHNWKVPFLRMIDYRWLLALGLPVGLAYGWKYRGLIGAKTGGALAGVANKVSQTKGAQNMAKVFGKVASTNAGQAIKAGVARTQFTGWFKRIMETGKAAAAGSLNKLGDLGVNAASTAITLSTDTLAAKAVAAVFTPVGATIATAGALEYLFGPSARRGAASIWFNLHAMSQWRREPVNFLPLSYSGRPYLAGVQGMRRSRWWEPTADGLRRLKYFYFDQSWRYITKTMDFDYGRRMDESWSNQILSEWGRKK